MTLAAPPGFSQPFVYRQGVYGVITRGTMFDWFRLGYKTNVNNATNTKQAPGMPNSLPDDINFNQMLDDYVYAVDDEARNEIAKEQIL